jgi:radical SAM protein with 4Fe4S-binding SPASM domain
MTGMERAGREGNTIEKDLLSIDSKSWSMKTARISSDTVRTLQLEKPAFAYLEITYACQGRCPGCPSTYAQKEDITMSGSQWTAIIKELAIFLEEARLTGGEPTLHPEFMDILESMEKNRLPFKIYTNGLMPDPDRIFRALKKSRSFRGFFFSLHGPLPSIHEAFSGLQDFSTILSTMEKAVKHSLPVYTSTVLGEFNRNHIAETLRLATKLGSRRHHFLRYIGPYKSGISLHRENLVALLDHIAMIPPSFSYRAGECFPRCFYPASSRCLAGITHITISPSGLIKACPFSEETLGKGEFTRKNKLLGGKRILEWTSDFPPNCLHCSEVESCMGGCRAMRRNFLFKRDPLMEEPLPEKMVMTSESGEKPLSLKGRFKLIGTLRREKFGFLLMREGEVIPVSEKGYEALKICDGTRGMGEIDEIAGSKAMEFLLSLYRRGFIEII